MSSRARLILLSGVGGAGTTTICAATVAALEDEGLRVRGIDASEPLSPDPEVVDLVSTTIGALFAEVGADPVIAQAWTGLAGVTHLTAIAHIRRALADASLDAVVVDCGDLRRARELIELPDVLGRLLDAAITPRLAMWRSAAGTSLFEALSAARTELVRAHRAFTDAGTTMRLVTTAGEDAVARIERALAVFALLGIAVDGVIVNRFPRKAEGSSTDAVERAQDSLSRLAAVDDVAVWKSTSTIRPVPKGRSAMGPLGRVQVLDAEQLTVHVLDEEFALDVPLAAPARAGAEVGAQEGRLVVAFDGATRWLDLPPVLLRCHPSHAVRTGTGLRVVFVPDPAAWRQPEVVS